MHGQTVLITGADGGIGREITKALAKKGATIVMACIDLNDARPVYESIKQESDNVKIEMMQIDLASLGSIREFAKQLSQKYSQLHVLINNAGIFSGKRKETPDGFEATMGVNYLGPFLLTNLLLPILKQAPGARIVNVASNAYVQGKIDFDDPHFNKKYKSFKAYATSKLAVVLFTMELAECLEATSVTANALHPGHASTEIWNLWPEKWYQPLLNKIMKRFTHSPEEAAQTSIYLASSDEVQGVTGEYFDKKKLKTISAKCKDKQLQKEFWELSEKLTGLI
jgi:NAD(P)-dependent dehydrogenase (short-subunit alcohol dehydrogenase family)